MNADSGVPLTSLKVDGGMVVNELLMQFQADILGVPGDPPGGRRDHRAGRGLRGRAGRRLLGRARTTSAPTGPRTSSGTRTWTKAPASETYRNWKKAVTKTFDWVDDDD